MTAPMDAKLKECPFCGDDHYVYIIEPEDSENTWAVGCFAQMEGGCGFSSEFTSEKYAIEAWNRRQSNGR